MIPLHTIIEPIDQIIAWFGTGFRCDNTYHRGYDDEREVASMHYECALVQLNEMREAQGRGRPYHVYYCECTCRQGERGHYFSTDNPTEQYRNDDGFVACAHCRANQHPTPPEGTT